MATDRGTLIVLLLAVALLLGACGSDGAVVKNAYMRGVDHHDDGLYHEAIREYQAALGDEPEDHRAWFNLGLCYHELANASEGEEAAAWFAKAGAAYERAAANEAGRSRAELARARLLWDSGRTEEAMGMLKGMVGDDAVGAGAPALTLASMHLNAGRRSEAEAEYRRALALEENEQTAVAGLAALLVTAGRDAEAAAILDPAIGTHRYNLTLRVLRAGISERRAEGSRSEDDWKEALHTWEQAEAFAAGDWEIAAGLARCSAALGDTVRAVRYYWYATDAASDHALIKRGYDPGAWRAGIRKQLLGLYLRLPATIESAGG